MKAFKPTVALLAAGLLGLAVADGQDRYVLNYRATCQAVDDSGRIKKQNLNTQAFIRQLAAESGLTNFNSLALVYHLDADPRGDAIELVRTTDGTVLNEKFALFYPRTITNADGSQFQQFAHLYTDQQSEIQGTSVVSGKVTPDRNAGTRTVLRGTLQYYLLPQNDEGLRICTANFTTGKLFVTNAASATRNFSNLTNLFVRNGSPE